MPIMCSKEITTLAIDTDIKERLDHYCSIFHGTARQTVELIIEMMKLHPEKILDMIDKRIKQPHKVNNRRTTLSINRKLKSSLDSFAFKHNYSTRILIETLIILVLESDLGLSDLIDLQLTHIFETNYKDY